MTIEISKAVDSEQACRVGDAQRAECAEALADAFVRGELLRGEFDARTELCFAAVTQADLARLTADLPVQTSPVSSAGRRVPRPAAVSLSRLIGFEVILLAVAYVLGVDLESELRVWYVIAFEIWALGSLAGVVGASLLRPVRDEQKE